MHLRENCANFIYCDQAVPGGLAPILRVPGGFCSRGVKISVYIPARCGMLRSTSADKKPSPEQINLLLDRDGRVDGEGVRGRVLEQEGDPDR